MSKARGLADLGNVYDDGALSNRNLIINGAMQVAQRGTSFTPSAAATTYTLDRFSFYQNAGTVGVDQATDSPDGFEYSLKCEVDATGSVASDTILQVGQPIEGYNLAPLDWNGGSNAQPATASFWVKSSETGVYGFRIRLGGAGTFIKEFTINSSNTWEQKTVLIPACPYTIPNKTNATGIFTGVQLVSGSTYHAASDGVWQTADAYGTSGMDNDWITTSGATFQITGVQLEVGDTATPFEHRSYGDELARCQRYFQVFEEDGDTTFGSTVAYATNAAYDGTQHIFPVEMRASPTRSTSGTWQVTDGTGGGAGITAFYGNNTKWGYQLGAGVASGLTTGKLYFIRALSGTGSKLKFDAEL